MTVRYANAADLSAIARIRGASPTASQWDPADYFAHHCFVAEEGGSTLGFLVIRSVMADEYEVLNLAVDLSMRRRGVARRLLEHALAQRHGAWFLEVRESNSGAIEFYAALGFQRAGRRANYYRDPPEAAIVMKFNS
jgi:[ribosomal protein S18]-alanine N-acetyltransferase